MMRSRQLRLHPLCLRCEKERGLVVAATTVDHRIPHRGNEALFFDEGNLDSLCASCHSSKTALEDGGFGRAPVLA